MRNSFRWKTVFTLAQCLAVPIWIVLSACTTAAQRYGEHPVTLETQYESAYNAVAEYVRRTRGWPPHDYRIELKGRKGDILDWWVIHKNDEKPGMTDGGGLSFTVDLDTKSLQVVKEFGFQ